MNRNLRQNNGLIATATIFMVMAVSLVIVLTMTFVSIGEMKAGLSQYQGEDNLAFVEGCTEDMLLKSLASVAYTGGNITRPEGTCTVSISKSGNVWTATVSTTATNFRRTIQVIFVQNTTNLTITSWQEI